MNDRAGGETPPPGSIGQQLYDSISRRPIAASFGLVILLTLYYHLSWPTFHDFIRAIDFCDIPFCDFVVFYYPMGREVFLTKSPIIGFDYSPFTALVFSIFGMFPLEVSTVIWVLLLIASMAGLVFVSLIVVAPKQIKQFFLPSLLLVFTSFPLLHNFKWGQVSVLLTLLPVLALLAARKDRWILSSLFLACAISLKYFPVLFILPFVFKNNWRVVGGVLGWCVALFVLIPSGFFGISATTAFLGQIAQGTINKQIAARGLNSQFFVNVVIRWCSTVQSESVSLKPILRGISFLIVEGVLAFIFFLIKSNMKKSMEYSFVLLFLSVPFFVATSWPHYLVYLPFCQLFLGSELLQGQKLGVVRRVSAAGMILLSILLASVFMFQLMGTWERYSGAGLLLIADVLLIISSVVLLLPQIRSFRRQTVPSREPAPRTVETNR